MFFDNFEKLCKEQDIKVTTLVNILGLSKSGISRWRAGNIPNGETLIKIADYFNCSIDFLLGRSENVEVPVLQVFNTTPEERENARSQRLMITFKKLNDQAQDAVLDYITYMSTQPKNLKNEDNSAQINA